MQQQVGNFSPPWLPSNLSLQQQQLNQQEASSFLQGTPAITAPPNSLLFPIKVSSLSLFSRFACIFHSEWKRTLSMDFWGNQESQMNSATSMRWRRAIFPGLVLTFMNWIINELDRWITKLKKNKSLLSNMWHYLHLSSKNILSEYTNKILWHFKVWHAEASRILQYLNTFLTHLIPTS